MFGLANPLRLFKLSKKIYEVDGNLEASITLLRDLAEQCKFDKDECLIQHRPESSFVTNLDQGGHISGSSTLPGKQEDQHSVSETNGLRPCQYTTAVPHPIKSNKRNISGEILDSQGHAHWIYDGGEAHSNACGFQNDVDDGRRPGSNDHEMSSDLVADSNQYTDSDCTYFFKKNSIVPSKYSPGHFHWSPAPWAFTKVYQSWKQECVTLAEPRSKEILKKHIVAGEEKWGLDLDGPYKTLAEGPQKGCTFRRIAGNNTAALFITDHTLKSLPSLSLKTWAHLLRSGSVDRSWLVEYLELLAGKKRNLEASRLLGCEQGDFRLFFYGLAAVEMITYLYNEWPGATVSIDVTKTAIGAAHWAKAMFIEGRAKDGQQSAKRHPDMDPQATVFRSAKFACIAMMESGIQDLYPSSLKSVMAMASGNSIYVAESLLQDPSQIDGSGLPEFSGIRRILGNLDRPGIVMLVPPQAPRIRKVDMSSWRVVKQTLFDGQSRDHFGQSSLHLSFTNFEVPIAIVPGACDADVVLLEAFVSVHDGRDWVADLDILGSFSSGRIRSPAGCECLRGRASNGIGEALLDQFGHSLKSISNWEELLCCQDNLLGFEIGAVRSHGNWLSRLAAASICAQIGCYTTILPSHCICLDCGWMTINRMLWHREHERRGTKLDVVIM